jgi:hypothetical protein
MFQEPPDDEVHSDVEEETQIDEIDVPAPPAGHPIISVDGTSQASSFTDSR